MCVWCQQVHGICHSGSDAKEVHQYYEFLCMVYQVAIYPKGQRQRACRYRCKRAKSNRSDISECEAIEASFTAAAKHAMRLRHCPYNTAVLDVVVGLPVKRP